jgi:hypothetical protein
VQGEAPYPILDLVNFYLLLRVKRFFLLKFTLTNFEKKKNGLVFLDIIL